MPNHAMLQSSLVWLAAIVVATGIYTQSMKKMIATYLLGMFGIAGFLLPDWTFFDRHVSQWFSPVSVDDAAAHSAQTPKPTFSRFRVYPLKLLLYALVYGSALYKWWVYVSS
ncbi:hypothetical protein NMG60_11016798 [Bertholletia excelsa]